MQAADLPDYTVSTVVAHLNVTEFGTANEWQIHYKSITGEKSTKVDRAETILRCCYYIHFGRI